MNMFFLQLLLGIIFLTIIFLHVAKKNFGVVIAYGIQSLAISLMMFGSYFETHNIPLLLVAVLTLAVKAILVPAFFIRLIQKHELTFSVSTYLNTPTTLIILAALTAAANHQKLAPLVQIVPAHHSALVLALSSIFFSLFLIVNRKGALSQALGILSLENSIVAFALMAGLEQSPLLQVGIIFDIFIWLVIATVFISMIYRHFGSLDTRSMTYLTD